jgi:hypothetical protein
MDAPQEKPQQPPQPSLSSLERWNVACLILAFSCVVATLTMVVGTGAVVVKSIGGSNALAPFALG